MGNTPSHPVPGKQLQVIGAGLSRTGTSSFAQALEILLSGPAYHGGSQLLLGGVRGEDHPKSWHSILARTPIKTPQDREYILQMLRRELDGFVGCADYPCAQFTEELMELYPEAKVICTTRDFAGWDASFGVLRGAGSTRRFLSWALFFVPQVRYAGQLLEDIMTKRWVELYREGGMPDSRTTWEKHHRWLERVVPEEKLFFFDVREGWEPLCKFLGKEVPRACDGTVLPFPRINEARATKEFMEGNVRKGLMVWAGLVLIIAVVVGLVYAKLR